MELISELRLKFILGFQPYVGLFGSAEIILCLTILDLSIFAGYSHGCSLDSVVGFPTTGRSAGTFGYWVQPIADGTLVQNRSSVAAYPWQLTQDRHE